MNVPRTQFYFLADVDGDGDVSTAELKQVLRKNPIAYESAEPHEKVHALLSRNRRQIGHYHVEASGVWDGGPANTANHPFWSFHKCFTPGRTQFYLTTICRHTFECFLQDGCRAAALPPEIAAVTLLLVEALTLMSFLISPPFTLLGQSRCEILGAAARVLCYLLSVLCALGKISEHAAFVWMARANYAALAHLFFTHLLQLLLFLKDLALSSYCRRASHVETKVVVGKAARQSSGQQSRQSERRRHREARASAAKARHDAQLWRKNEEKGRHQARARQREDHARRDAERVMAEAAGGQSELRIDVSDGRPYTKSEFMEFYGGAEEYDAAPRAAGGGNGGSSGRGEEVGGATSAGDRRGVQSKAHSPMHGAVRRQGSFYGEMPPSSSKAAAHSRRARSPTLQALLQRSQTTFGTNAGGSEQRRTAGTRHASLQGGKALLRERASSADSVMSC